MKVLVIGSGGREHALIWKISRSPLVSKIYCCPGSDAIGALADCIPMPEDGFKGLLQFCHKNEIDLTVVGPEQPLVDGIVDLFQQAGLAIFGPLQAAAQLEGSKIFAKRFMADHAIPTARFQVFNETGEAIEYINSTSGPWVIKADGLAAGKGVIICHDETDAFEAIRDMIERDRFGRAGKRIIIEECLKGEEGSFIVLTDGKNIVPLATSQDHKAVFDGDQGPNTGGMGAYSPAPILEGKMTNTIMDQIIKPTIRGMAQDGIPFRGVLYAGLMIVDGKPFVLEFNVRFGDPETQPILTRLKSDIVPLLAGSAKGDMPKPHLDWRDDYSVIVILASGGYPESYQKGHIINGLDKLKESDDLVVFHSGTKKTDKGFVTSGGRVLGITSLGKTLTDARTGAYQAINKILFEKCHFRTDIADKALRSDLT